MGHRQHNKDSHHTQTSINRRCYPWCGLKSVVRSVASPRASFPTPTRPMCTIFKLLWISIKPILACNKNLQSVGEHDKFGGVIEHNADALIAQLVAEAILVAVVHPLAHPHQRLRRWVAQLVGQALRTTLQLKEQIQF